MLPLLLLLPPPPPSSPSPRLQSRCLLLPPLLLLLVSSVTPLPPRHLARLFRRTGPALHVAHRCWRQGV